MCGRKEKDVYDYHLLKIVALRCIVFRKHWNYAFDRMEAMATTEHTNKMKNRVNDKYAIGHTTTIAEGSQFISVQK